MTKKGYKLTEEHKKKLSEAHKGTRGYWRGKKRPNVSGKNHYLWKGKKASYRAKHHWIQNNYGIPGTCEYCQKENLTGRQIHWANISGKYLRIRTDWIRLCINCHFSWDAKRNPRHYKHTEKSKRQISISRLKRKKRLGYLNSPETRRRISESRKGKIMPAEQKLKISKSLLRFYGKKVLGNLDCG